MSWLRRLFRRPKGLRYPNGVPRVIDEWASNPSFSTEGAIPRVPVVKPCPAYTLAEFRSLRDQFYGPDFPWQVYDDAVGTFFDPEQYLLSQRIEYNTVDLVELHRERKRQTFARTAQFLLSQQK